MKQLLWVLCLGLVCLTAIPLYAQDTIQTTSDTVHIDLPDTITFQLLAESDNLLEQAVLVYGTNGLTCQPGGSRQPVAFESAGQIDIAWTWELKRSRTLPPGAEVWWRWEITDAEGNRSLTERQAAGLLDTAHNWRSLSRDGVTVYWYAGNANFAEFVLQEAIESLDRLVEEVGVPRLEAVQLWVYDSPAAMRSAVVNVPEWTGGVAFPEYGVTVIAAVPGRTEWSQRIIRHELAHLVVEARVFNCRGIRLPTWLSEGLSRYAERTDPSLELQPVRAALANGTLPPLRSLARGFSAYSNAASLSYSQSYAVVSFLIEAYGPERMDLLLGTMQAGQPIDAALMTVYGFDTAGLDVAWRNAEGYPATPTSAADALVLAATPTQIATLALGGVPMAQTTATPTAVPTLTPTANPTATPPRPTPPAETAVSPTPHAPTATPVADPPAPETAVMPRTWLFGGLGLVLLAALILIYSMTRRP